MLYLTHHMALENTNRDPGHAALIHGDLRLDSQATVERAASIAAGLRDLGIARGDRVAVFLNPGLDLPLAILGISMAGAAFVPVHHGLFPDQVAHILADCGAAGLIADGRKIEKLEPVLHRATSLQTILAADPLHDRIAKLDVQDFHRISGGKSAAPADICIEKDLAAVLYTSGSTGLPKGVMLSHANLIAGAEIVSDYLSVTDCDRILAALPFSFDAGLNQLTTALLKGATTVLLEFRFGRDIVRQLVDHRITGLAGVPSLWSLLAQPSSGLSKQPLDHLRYITNTGGAMPLNVLQQLRDALPATEVFLMYGLTEAFRSTYLPPEELDRRPTSIGRAIPNTEIMVVSDDGRPCGPGEVGELVHHGPTVSLGYWGHPELTAKVLRPHPFPQAGRAKSDLVCYSGDLVRRDQDGFLYFAGRRDNLIKSAGFRISPTEVEEVICSVAPVRQVAVIGVPDPVMGQVLVAFAIPEEGAGDLVPAAILAKCSTRLPRHMVPKEVKLVDDLPMTASGKVNYPALRQSLDGEGAATQQEPDLADA